MIYINKLYIIMATRVEAAYNVIKLKSFCGSDFMKAPKINIKRLFMTAFLIYTAVTLINQQVAIGKLTQIQAEKALKVESIKQENKKLVKMIERASTDESIEKMAREQLGLVKPGEKVYINQSEPDNNLQGGDN